MKLSEWANIAEVVGSVAIIASLIFVGLEVRENTQVVRLTSDRALDHIGVILNASIANNADLAELLVKGESDRDSLSAVERARFDSYCFSRFGVFENVVGNYAGGFMPDDEYLVWAKYFERRLGKPGYRQFWLENRDSFFPNFQAWVNRVYGL